LIEIQVRTNRSVEWASSLVLLWLLIVISYQPTDFVLIRQVVKDIRNDHKALLYGLMYAQVRDVNCTIACQLPLLYSIVLALTRAFVQSLGAEHKLSCLCAMLLRAPVHVCAADCHAAATGQGTVPDHGTDILCMYATAGF